MKKPRKPRLKRQPNNGQPKDHAAYMRKWREKWKGTWLDAKFTGK